MTKNQETSEITNHNLDIELFDAVVAITNSIPAHQNLNIKLLTIAPGRAELKMTVGSEFSNSYGIAHGGVIATFADSAMGVALRTLNIKVVTLEINLNFLVRVETGENLIVKACSIHTGKQVLVAEAEVYNSKNKLVSKSRATFFRVGRIID
jgi:acyl-CoA thioesterase